MQGSHPEDTNASALDHILGEHATIPLDRGLFLAETWRLHPTLCSFTSEMFYEGRLFPRPSLDQQTVKSTGPVRGSGLRYLAVSHQGNQSSSPEEADAIRALVEQILSSNTTWVDRDGQERAITLDGILIIAPYNAQVFELQDRLPGARIGTVDKFQGQEAPIVIFSMTTSSHADAPRGMEFLYSANRLNVATSHAKCVCGARPQRRLSSRPSVERLIKCDWPMRFAATLSWQLSFETVSWNSLVQIGRRDNDQTSLGLD